MPNPAYILINIQMSDTSPSKKTGENAVNLYELPVCTVCLNELSSDLYMINCGHVFHRYCISTHLQYRKSCPNCQRRVNRSDLKPLVMNFELCNKSMPQIKSEQLSSQKRDILQETLSKLKIVDEKKEKLEIEHTILQKRFKQELIEKQQLEKSLNSMKSIERKFLQIKEKLIETKQILAVTQSEKNALQQKVGLLLNQLSQGNMLKQIKSKITQQSSLLGQQKKKFQALKNYKQGFEYFSLTAMSIKLDLRHKLQQNMKLQKQNRQFSSKVQNLTNEVNRLKTLNIKQSEQINNLRARAQKDQVYCLALTNRIKELSPSQAFMIEQYRNNMSQRKLSIKPEKEKNLLKSKEKSQLYIPKPLVQGIGFVNQLGVEGQRKLATFYSKVKDS